MPAELVSAAVAVGADAGAKPLDLVDQLFPSQLVQIFIHVGSSSPPHLDWQAGGRSRPNESCVRILTAGESR